MRPIFITATGTDVGKTYVTCALIGALKAKWRDSQCAQAPSSSGFSDDDAAGKATAAAFLGALRAAARSRGARCDFQPWRFRAALSVEMAAEREGRKVPFDEGRRVLQARGWKANPGLCLVEGVGGLIVADRRAAHQPRFDRCVASDRRCSVAGSYLGNDLACALTRASAAARGGEAQGRRRLVIFGNPSPRRSVLAELAQRLAGFTSTPIVVIARNGEAARSACRFDSALRGLISIGVPGRDDLVKLFDLGVCARRCNLRSNRECSPPSWMRSIQSGVPWMAIRRAQLHAAFCVADTRSAGVWGRRCAGAR